jgi:hypothetical protein
VNKKLERLEKRIDNIDDLCHIVTIDKQTDTEVVRTWERVKDAVVDIRSDIEAIKKYLDIEIVHKAACKIAKKPRKKKGGER